VLNTALIFSKAAQLVNSSYVLVKLSPKEAADSC